MGKYYWKTGCNRLVSQPTCGWYVLFGHLGRKKFSISTTIVSTVGSPYLSLYIYNPQSSKKFNKYSYRRGGWIVSIAIHDIQLDLPKQSYPIFTRICSKVWIVWIWFSIVVFKQIPKNEDHTSCMLSSKDNETLLSNCYKKTRGWACQITKCEFHDLWPFTKN